MTSSLTHYRHIDEMTGYNWNEFCEFYYETAKKEAELQLKRLVSRKGDADKHVDGSYVIDAAVLSALEKTFTHFDVTRSVKITTYLSRLIHNEVVDEYTRECKAAARQEDIDDIKTCIKSYAEDISAEAKEELIARLRIAIAKLSPSDQIILNYWLEDKSSYVVRSVKTLGTTESYVTLRRFRIFKQLPQLMGMTRDDYLLYESKSTILANNTTHKSISHFEEPRTLRPNPIMPSLNHETIANRFYSLITF